MPKNTKKKARPSPPARERKAPARRGSACKPMVWLLPVILLAAAGFYLFSGSGDAPGQAVASMGNAHILPGADALMTYNSDPPTSGPHYGSLAPWGIHQQPISKGLQIHNLEDGGVLVQYNCGDCPELVEKLRGIAGRHPSHVILAPYPGMKRRIALTAWGRIDTFDEFDEKRITRFIEAYRGIDHHR